jgi:hypothetical protein
MSKPAIVLLLTLCACHDFSWLPTPRESTGGETTETPPTVFEDPARLGPAGLVLTRCPPTRDVEVHVDAGAPPGGNGTKECPFGTITEALAHPAARVILIGKGLYDREKLPLVVRGVELRGEGEDTVIEGVGGYMSFWSGAYATMLVGHPEQHTRLARLKLRTTAARMVPNTTAVVCSEGNISLPGQWTKPNTEIDEVWVEGRYETGIAARAIEESSDRGCNVRVTSSHIDGPTTGIEVDGQHGPFVAAEIGAEMHGNVITGRHADGTQLGPDAGPPGQPRTGIALRDRVTWLTVRETKLEHFETGLTMNLTARPAPPVQIIDNVFYGLTVAGIQATQWAVIAELSGNRFSGIGSTGPTPAAALVLYTGFGKTPRVARARDNVFVDNDIGVLLAGSDPQRPEPGRPWFDFGREGDPGNNTFRCNATQSMSGTGGDFIVRVDVVGDAILLSGNEWDRRSPDTQHGPGARNGIDIHVVGKGQVDASEPRWRSRPCAPGRQD